MSRLAQEFERQVKEMRAKAAKERPRKAPKEAAVNGDEFFNQEEGLHSAVFVSPGMT